MAPVAQAGRSSGPPGGYPVGVRLLLCVVGEGSVTTVIVVDDHELVAEGLRRVVGEQPDFEVVAVLSSGDELLAHLAAGSLPDLCTVDLSMPGVSGLELVRLLRSDYPAVHLLVCSANASAEVAVRCLRAGAAGFISKFRPQAEFVVALRQVARGERYIDADLMSEVVSRLTAGTTGPVRHERLSEREYDVMLALARGESIKGIAAAMYLSPKTITTYRTRVLAKLEVRSNAEITAYALRHELIDLSAV